MNEIMNTWILQMGYPVVHFKVEGDMVKLSQKRFLYNDSQAGPEDMYVPLSL